MNRLIAAILLVHFVPCLHADDAKPDLLIADFEGETYGDWKTTGKAFGPGPARGTLPNQMHVDGFKGNGLVNSYFEGDQSTGTLTSPEFKIERKYISFLIGGGKDPKNLCINLLVKNKIVRTATGPNDRNGGSEKLSLSAWDVTEMTGEKAVIQIIDQATGGWGHINIDHIVQTDVKPPMPIDNATRDFKIEKRYLLFPIKNGATKRNVTLKHSADVVVKNEMELADGTPDWWALMDVSSFRGQTVTIHINQLSAESKALEQIIQSDAIYKNDTTYRESLRGQFHFSSRRGWLNDPNGMVYYDGEYHLFYQHNPYGWGWGNMHWGHAVSKNMVQWDELSDALMPDAFGPMFSGSAVVDWNNTSDFGKDGKPPLVLIYTAAGNPSVQCIAYSIDGRNFTKYSGNPVVKQITDGNRDPKVCWHEPSKKWIMVLYVEKQKTHTIHFLTSPNLREWTVASILEGGKNGNSYLFECPDFFELPIDGNTDNKKWILTAANSHYAIGTFDGTTFKPEYSNLKGHQGQGFYAAQTFSDIPKKDVRRIQMGWFQTETKGMTFNQSMTIPLEMKLISTADGPRLTWTPVKELETLRSKTTSMKPSTLNATSINPFGDNNAELVELNAEFEPDQDGKISFSVRGAAIEYDAKKQELSVNRHRIHAPLQSGKQRLTIYCDRTGLEVFASNGQVYVPMPFQPKADQFKIEVSVPNGSAKFSKLELHELKSAWK